MTWTSDMTALLAHGGDDFCQAGHTSHATIRIDIDLNEHTVPDVPRSTGTFPINVYDWARYHGIPNYCPGNDELSLSIATQGIWEGFETSLTQAILRTPGLVIDFGASAGWYTIIAAHAGCPVLAIEADTSNAHLLTSNLALNDITHLVDVCHGWIGATTPPLTADQPVRLVKSDVEGAEDHVMRVCGPLMAAGLIDYVLLEVSPILADHYPATLTAACAHGYDAFLIPEKGYPPDLFAADPLTATLACPIQPCDVAGLRQRSVLLARSAP